MHFAVAKVTVHDLPLSLQEVGTNISPFSLRDRRPLERFFSNSDGAVFGGGEQWFVVS